MTNWLKRLFGGSDSSANEAPEPETAPEPPSMPAEPAPAAEPETSDEPASAVHDEPA
jgi:hypothetical protein